MPDIVVAELEKLLTFWDCYSKVHKEWYIKRSEGQFGVQNLQRTTRQTCTSFYRLSAITNTNGHFAGKMNFLNAHVSSLEEDGPEQKTTRFNSCLLRTRKLS